MVGWIATRFHSQIPTSPTERVIHLLSTSADNELITSPSVSAGGYIVFANQQMLAC